MKLKPFVFEDTPVVDEEFAILTVKNFLITGDQLVGEMARVTAQVCEY